YGPFESLTQYLPALSRPADEGLCLWLRPGGSHTLARVPWQGQTALKISAEYPVANFRSRLEIWIDPDTRLSLHQERRDFDARTGRLICQEVSSGYRYDCPPPEGIFALPRPGQTLKRAQAGRIARDVTLSLSAAERRAIDETIRRSEAGWRAGDFEAFASTWL